MRIIVGVSGASGVIMAKRLIETIKAETEWEVHLVVSDSAVHTWALETDEDISALYELADVNYEPYDMAASISSGSFVTEGMIVLPCSMKTLAGIVSGYTDNLLLRAADVCMKEGRKLVVCPRETPFGKVHLRNLYEASQLGCTVVPPMLTFYSGAKTLDEQIDHVIGKILLQFGIVPKSFKQWK
ncbi:MAG: UbiX family flavin prenyltransferase [Oscillospiraceae bacterium]|nr:UbiX family flavin prenyltransferase [Oscillospiraceae bacterium]